MHWLTKIQWELLAKAVHSGREFGVIGSFSTLIFYSHHSKLLPRCHTGPLKRDCAIKNEGSEQLAHYRDLSTLLMFKLYLER